MRAVALAALLALGWAAVPATALALPNGHSVIMADLAAGDPSEPCQDPRLIGVACHVCFEVLYYDPDRVGPYDPPPYGEYLVVCKPMPPPS